MVSVSIIVPIYNVEQYLDECVKSIISQTYKNIEIILVDDESPDNSPAMCDEYAKSDERVKVIHKKNGGLSSARNAGLDIATGDYVLFIDSDDYITNDFVEQLLHTAAASKADIAMCNFTSDTKTLDLGISDSFKIYTPKQATRAILKEHISTMAQTKLFRAELLDGIRFPLGRIYEDYGTIYKLFDKAGSIACVDTRKYYYRYNPDSITNKRFSLKQMDYYAISDEVEAFIIDKYPSFKKHVRNRATRMSISFLKKISEIGFDDRAVIDFLIAHTRTNIARYMFSGYSPLSKAYGLYVSLFPKKALRMFKK